MKQGKSIVELAQELQRRATVKEDFLAPTKKVHLLPETQADDSIEHKLVIAGEVPREFEVTQHTHRQLGTWAGVPAKYYDRMREEAPELLSNNINHWLDNSGVNRMVRTLDGTSRAFLSDKYRRIDNEDVAEQVLPILLDSGNFSQIISSEVTDRKMYIKALFPRMESDIAVGDPVQSGVLISNSEIGAGSLSIQPLIYRLVCSNGMVSQDYGLSRYHVGRKVQGDGDNAFALFTDETLKADDDALMLKIRDIIQAASQRDVFDAMVAKMREATQTALIEKPVEAVEIMAKNFTLNDGEKQSVLENLIRGGDYSKWGAVNAVTRVANENDNYDRATEFEVMGGKLLDLPKKDWTVISQAS